VAIGEHPIELATDQPTAQPAPDHPQRGLILDLIPQDCSPLTIIEKPMAMVPPGKRARLLAIREQVGRIVFGVDSDPSDRKRPEMPAQHDLAARQ
jgi:hypothetical protein